MRITTAVVGVALALSVAACQDVTAPDVAEEPDVAFVVTHDQQTGPDNRCYGEIISGIANTWPWAHVDHASFPPPPGAIALWLKTFGPALGISTVRELQILFCG